MVWRVLLNNVLKLLLGGELVLMYGVFTELDFYKVDLSLVCCKLVCQCRWAVGVTVLVPLLSAAHFRSVPPHFLSGLYGR